MFTRLNVRPGTCCLANINSFFGFKIHSSPGLKNSHYNNNANKLFSHIFFKTSSYQDFNNIKPKQVESIDSK